MSTGPTSPRPSTPASNHPCRAEARARRALEIAFHGTQYPRIARAAILLQEARSVIRERALADSSVHVLTRIDTLAGTPRSGCVLICPPLIGAEGRAYRERAWARRVFAFVLVREPRTSAGKWPIVAVDERAYRVRVQPPPQARIAPGTLCGDTVEGDIAPAWFAQTADALGQSIVESISALEHPAWRVEDLFSASMAHPDSGEILAELARTARIAGDTPPPTERRPGPEDEGRIWF